MVRRALRALYRRGVPGALQAPVDRLRARLRGWPVYVRSAARGYRADPPSGIRIEPSSFCNLRCQHCPTGTDYPGVPRSIMSEALFEEVLDQMKRLPTLRSAVLYLAGEPLLNKDIASMCRRVKEETSVLSTHLNTNGMLLDDERCRQLRDARLNHISVSIDGCCPEENDRIRTGSDYHRVRENVARLQRYLVGTETKIVIDNVLVASSVGQITGGPQPPSRLQRDFSGVEVRSHWAMDWLGLDLAKSSLEGVRAAPALPRFNCTFPFTELTVRANGDIVMCCYDLLSQEVMGNVADAFLGDVWNGAEYEDARRGLALLALRGRHGQLPRTCRTCVFVTGNVLIREGRSDVQIA